MHDLEVRWLALRPQVLDAALRSRRKADLDEVWDRRGVEDVDVAGHFGFVLYGFLISVGWVCAVSGLSCCVQTCGWGWGALVMLL